MINIIFEIISHAVIIIIVGAILYVLFERWLLKQYTQDGK